MRFEIIGLVLVIIGFIIVMKIMKKGLILIVNSIFGLFALFGFNALFSSEITINIWSVLITAIGGSIGFFIVILLHFLGLAF